jgi:AcrR family transcriptional regulator
LWTPASHLSRASLSIHLSALAPALGCTDDARRSAHARDRARAEITEEIKTVARRHVAEQGSAALSLRAVAREVGMVSSAVYRYFPSRDELLTALIVDAYDAVGEAAEHALAAKRRGGFVARWVSVTRAIRSWALAHPHEYALIYGSPVPGYAAPQDTIDPASRVTVALLRVVVDGVAAGEIATAATESTKVPRALHADFAAIRALAAPEVPDVVLSRSLLAWSQLFGSISLEMFGHLHNVIHDFDAYFDFQMRVAARQLASLP